MRYKAEAGRSSDHETSHIQEVPIRLVHESALAAVGKTSAQDGYHSTSRASRRHLFLYRAFSRRLWNGWQPCSRSDLLFFPGFQNPIVLVIGIIVVLVAGIWSGGMIERPLEAQDPGIVVIDEVLGQWMALLTLRYAGNIAYVIVAFLFFRIFDVIKLSPARYFDRKHGGTGIMLDDAVAGIYAWIAAHVVMYFFSF